MESGYDRHKRNQKKVTSVDKSTLTITAAQMDQGGMNGANIENVGAAKCTVTLPPALPGYQLTFINRGAYGFTLTPASGEYVSNGTAVGTVNQTATNTVAGCRITLQCNTTGVWYCSAVTGTWTLA